MSTPLLLLAAGGTGGHMFPAQALAEVMLARGWRVRLSTDARGARYAGGFPQAVEIARVSSATPARGGLLARALLPGRIGAGTAQAAWSMRRERPALVVGFGGYPSIPALAAARLLRVPAMLHEQNGVLGRVNRAFAARVRVVACGAWPTDLPQGAHGVHTGNPVRAAVLARAGAPYAAPEEGLPLGLLVIGGSQGAQVLSRVVPEAVARLPEAIRARVRIAHQARPEDAHAARAAYAGAGARAEVAPFFDDVPERLAGAQLVISRAGASSVADIACVGRPSILVPLAAAIRDEQTANARILSRADAAVLIPEAALTPDSLARPMTAILSDPEAARAMAEAALAVSRPEAAEALADLAEDVAGRAARGPSRMGSRYA